MHLAISVHRVLPSAFSYSVGIPKQSSYAAEYPAHTFPCPRLTPPSRAAPQDSGPLWVASPSTYDSFIHYTLPVLTGAQEAKQ